MDDEGNVYLAGVNADEHMMVFWEGSAQCEIVLPKPLPADLFSGLLLPCEQKGTAAPDSSAPEIKPVIQGQTRQVTPTEAPTSISATQ
ncbi:putative export usher protein [Escherichia coli]|uniref:Putative export usher protein n=1 Tax=Escherichia coli TaxID=562 RepID=A0A376WA97_ECOLX|nr:putative export usher protein [Escherichia coli]